MSEDVNPFDRIVESLYTAAFDPTVWPVVWDQTAKWLGAASGSLYLEGKSKAWTEVLALPGWPEKAQKLYLTHYNAVDPFANFGRGAPLSLRAILGQEIITAEEYERSEIWNDLGRPYMDAYHFLAAFIPVQSGIGGMLGFHRPRDDRPFSGEEQTQLKRLLPHLQRALQLGRMLAAERQLSGLRAATLDSIAVGVVIATDDAELVFANPTAERLAPQGGLSLGCGRKRLQAANRDEDSRLRTLIGDAARRGVGGPLLVSRPGGPRLALLVSPMPRSAGHPGPPYLRDNPVALITMRVVGQADADVPTKLSAAFDLTPAETGVLEGLLAGLSVEQIADSRHASPLTVRTQIRRLLMKLDAENLRELMRIAISCF